MPDLLNIGFDPRLSLPLIAALAAAMSLAAVVSGLGKVWSFVLRLLAAATVTLALLNPQQLEEDRNPLPDHVLVLVDRTESAGIGDRRARIDAGLTELRERLSEAGNLEVTVADIRSDPDGTLFTPVIGETLGNLPAAQLAGVIAITDGLVADIPDDVRSWVPQGIPFHALVLDEPDTRDRRIDVTLAPQYGLVGEEAVFELSVQSRMPGEGATVFVLVNGELVEQVAVTTGEPVEIPVEIAQRGRNTVTLAVEGVDGELTQRNNVYVSEVSGIRDRLRVLLITGQPHNGGRSWRNLLKSDPAVDLVQFTILTSVDKNPVARSSELSLIAFPTRQLFEDTLDEFDLVIFDQYTRRSTSNRKGRSSSLLSPYYIQNISEYVEDGGALLIATGPGFATDDSLYRSPLASVLPARPTGEIGVDRYRPGVTDDGARHPITAPLEAGSETWGPWFRLIESNVLSGNVLLEGPDAEPLLVIDKVGEGRVAMLLSDQAWLWSKGFDGGGPYSELFRRLSHWLMGEPDLAAESLSAHAEGDALTVERRTLSDRVPPTQVMAPDGTIVSVPMTQISEGIFQGNLPTSEPGAYRLASGSVDAVAAVGALNLVEYADLIPTPDRLRPVTEATGGTLANLDAIPSIMRPSPGNLRGDNLALIANGRSEVLRSSRAALLPGLVYVLFALLCLGLAWRQEGR